MKKIILSISILISLAASAQTSSQLGELFYFLPVSGAQRVHSSDSVNVFATLVTSSTITSMTVAQTGGPTVTIPAGQPVYTSGVLAVRNFWLQGLAPGAYTFKFTGVTQSGSTGSFTETVTVIPDVVCPPVPAQRVATSVTFTINGVAVTVPATGLKITYNNGSSQ
ncbi:MAG TPA: hypothetical protein VGN00_14335 [Puia sp.]|jgi:hypothetical protein